MTFPRPIHRAATMAAGLVVGSSLGLAAMPAYAGDDASEMPMTISESSDKQSRDTAGQEVADTTTNASASATASASASSSSKGQGDCVADSSASAEATAGDEQKEDHDSARQVSKDGDCEARSSSKASARTGESPSGQSDEK